MIDFNNIITINELVNIGLAHYLIIASILFAIGIFGLMMNRKNIVNILMSIELMLLAVNINFVAFSTYLSDISGQIFSIMILTIAAAETSIGLAIFLLYFRNIGQIDIDQINKMKG